MAVSLAQSALLSQNTLVRGVIETFVQTSKILELLPFENIEGNALAYNTEGTLPGVAFRDVNTAYTESTGTVNQSSEKLVILGGDADVDNFIVQTRGNLNDQRAVQNAMKVKALSYKFQDHFINGDVAVDTLGFDGLKKRLTGGQVIAAGTNGIPVVGTTDADRHAFWDAMDSASAAVPGGVDVWLMNANILAKARSNARRLTIFDQTTDAFGRQIQTYNGVPLIDIGQTAAGAMILPQTETQGSSNVAASIYGVRFGSTVEDGGVMGLTNGGVMVDDLGKLQAMNVWRTRIEFYCGLGIFSGKASVRLTGILNS